MEAIQIANCSTTLPPISQRVLPSKGLCKNLFGPVDHEEMSTILDSELKRDVEKKNEEWSFNFTEGTPLEHGRFVWEKVAKRNDDDLSTKSHKVTAIRRQSSVLHGGLERCSTYIVNNRSQNTGAQCQAATNENVQSVNSSPVDTLENKNKAPPISDRKRKRQCRTITDFMKQKKRRRVNQLCATEKDGKTKSNKFTCFEKDDISHVGSARKVKVFDKR